MVARTCSAGPWLFVVDRGLPQILSGNRRVEERAAKKRSVLEPKELARVCSPRMPMIVFHEVSRAVGPKRQTPKNRCLRRTVEANRSSVDLVLDHDSALHHKLHSLKLCDVLQRISGDCHNIGELTCFNNTDAILPAE